MICQKCGLNQATVHRASTVYRTKIEEHLCSFCADVSMEPTSQAPVVADPFAHIRRNDRIRAEQVRVISPEGKQLGIMPIAEALKLAAQAGLDLVELAPGAMTPVCRIMDFAKYVDEERRKRRGDSA